MTAPTTPREFAQAIGDAWRETTEGVLRTAGLYHQARRDLGEQGWGDLIAHVPHAGSTARRLALVGKWHGERDTWLPVSSLPPSWGTLYELSRVPDAELRQAIASGKVHSGMERAEATALQPAKAPRAAKAAASVPDPGVAAPVPQPPVSLAPTLPGAIDMLLALKDAQQPAHYAADLPRSKLAVALAFLTAVHKLAK